VGLDKWFKRKWVDISKLTQMAPHPPCEGPMQIKVEQSVERLRWLVDVIKEKKASVARKRKTEKGKCGSDRKPNYSK
jgi:hypothetical protein